MASNRMTFSVVLEAVTAAFNKAVKDAKANYTETTNGIVSESNRMATQTETISAKLKDIFSSKDATAITQALKAASTELNKTAQGATFTSEQMKLIGTAGKLAVNELNGSLKTAQAELKLLQSTKATPADIDAAKAKIASLKQSVAEAHAEFGRFQTAASTAMRRASADADSAAASAKGAGRAIYEALNIKTGGQLRAEIAQLTSSLAAFRANAQAPGAEIQRVTAAATARIRELRNEMNGLGPDSNNALASIQNIGKGALALAGVTIGLAGIKQGIEAVIQATLQYERINKQLEFATGSAERASVEFEFLKQVATDLGLELVSTAQGYAKLAAATKGTALEGEPTRKVFQGLAMAVASLGLSTEEAAGTMLALSQIASKGKVTMEELRGQLGERLPGAMAIAAKSMGVTIPELEKLVESGLDAVTFLKAFGPAMIEAFGPTAAKNVTTLQGSINLLKNRFTELLVDLGKGGVGDAAKQVFSDLATAIGTIQTAMRNLDPAQVAVVTEVFRQMYGVVTTTLGTLLSMIGDVANLLGSVSGAAGEMLASFGGVDDASDKVGFLTRTMQGLSITLGLVRDAVEGVKIAFTLATGVTQQFFANIALGLSKVTFGDLSADLLKFSQTLEKSSRESFARAEASALKFKSAAQSALESTAVHAETSGARVGAAATAAGSTAAAAFGKVGESAQASFRAAELAAANVSTHVAISGGQIVEVMNGISQVGTGVQDAFRAIGKEVGANIPPSVKTIEDMGVVLGALAAKSTKVAEDIGKAIPEALQKLNGPELKQFADSFIIGLQKAGAGVDVVKQALVELAAVAAKSLGVDITASLTRVSDKFKENQVTLQRFIDDFGLLKASGVDASRLIEDSLRAMLAKANNPAELRTLIQMFQTLGREGKISGEAMAQGVQQAKDKIDQLLPGINSLAEAFKTFGLRTREEAALSAAKYKEAFDVMKNSGKATLAELRTAFTAYATAAVEANQGVITAELAAKAAALGLKLEVDATGKLIIKSMDEASQATGRLKGGFDAATESVERTSDAYEKLMMKYKLSADYSERQIELLEKEAEQRQRLIDLENQRLNIDKQGFSKDKGGNTVNAVGDTWLSIMNALKGYGLDDAGARNIAREFTDAQGNVPYFSNPGQMKYGADTLSLAVQRAATQYLMRQSAPRVGGQPQGTTQTLQFVGPNGQTATVQTAEGTTAGQVLSVLESAGAVASIG